MHCLRLHLTEKQIIDIKVKLNVDVKISPKTLVASTPIESFEDMNLHPNIMKNIAFHSYIIPTPFKHKFFLWISLVVTY